MTNKTLAALLDESAQRHRHLCPRQVLGVRMGLVASRILALDLPQRGKRLLTIVENDGCFVDGITAATGCTLGHRTLRIEDYGKIAATFVDTELERAIRVIPRRTIREKAADFSPLETSKWKTQLIGYQRMPDEQLLHVQEVELLQPVKKIVSRAGYKTVCQQCGEEVINEREIDCGGRIICRACSGDAYYRVKYYADFSQIA